MPKKWEKTEENNHKNLWWGLLLLLLIYYYYCYFLSQLYYQNEKSKQIYGKKSTKFHNYSQNLWERNVFLTWLKKLGRYF